MIHHVLLQGEEVEPSIQSSESSLLVGANWKDSDSTNLDVTPDSMSWSLTLVNTGAGTSWINTSPASGDTGDTTVTVQAAEDNPDTSPRSMDITFSDDSGEATDLTLTITQQASTA